jgi:monovalent cation:H+ antiporter, CPA1 family
MIGLEALLIRFDVVTIVLAGATVPLVVMSRLAAVSIQPLLFGWTGLLSWRNAPFLAWAGIHGGISVALALSVPDAPARPIILTATYTVVLFSIIVQSSTLGFVARRTILKPDPR